MKKAYVFCSALLLSAFMVATPVTIKQSSNQTTTVSVSIEKSGAEARSRSSSRSRSYSRPSRSRSSSPSFKRRKKSGGSSSGRSRSWKPGSGVFKKGDSKGKQRAIKNRKKTPPTKSTRTPFKAKKPTTTTRKPTTRKPTTAKRPTSRRPAMTTAKRGTRLKSQRSSLSSPRARTTRLRAQRTRSRSMYQSRSRMRSMRSERNYWRSRAMYDRNYYYRSRMYGGWGYGYYPGLTYHRGWGVYGYGYTRGGLSIVDVMIIHSLFGHSRTPRGQTVINNYYIDGEKTDVVVVPKGSYIDEVDGQQVIMMPDGKGGTESSVIPEGSTITETKKGTLVQTPDGQGVLIPEGEEAYKAEAGYKVPESAQKPQEYDTAPSELH